MLQHLRRHLSLLMLSGIIAWFSIYPLTRKYGNALSWDVFGYYLYLPATFIWDDPTLKDFSKVQQVNDTYQNTPTFYQGSFTEDGKFAIKYSMGVAVLASPFFFAAHALAPALGYPADGFSLPYQYALIAANFFWLIIGFIFLRKALLKLFSDQLTALLLALVVLGTNYSMIVIVSPGMTHSFEFSLFAIILWLTIRWHETPSLRRAGWLGFFIGLSVLTRPSDGVIILLPLLWNVVSWKTFKEKMRWLFKEQRKHVLVLAGCAFVAGFPQLLYWRSVSGSWLHFSYNNNPGEGFEFFRPYVLEVLLSFRKGWLIYTPLMIFALAGLWMMWRRKRELFWPFFAFFLLNLWVVSSWSCWWYAGSYGHRAMVDSYSLMLVPMGFFFQQVLTKKNPLRFSVAALAVFFVALNLFQSWQFTEGIINDNRMTAAYYFRVFGKTSPPTEDDRRLLLIDRSTGEEEVFKNPQEYSSRILFLESFEEKKPGREKYYTDTLAHSGSYSYRLDSTGIFSQPLETAYRNITEQDHAWLRCSFWFYLTDSINKQKLSMPVHFNHGGKAYKYFAPEPGKKMPDAKPGQWHFFQVDYLTPEVRSTRDALNVYFWLQGKGAVFVDDLKVEAFEKRISD